MGEASVNATTYPSLETILNLVRVHLNDWQSGLTGTPGEGQITTDNPLWSPQTLPALNSAIRTLYRKLRNAGAPTLIKDNVQVLMPAINPILNPPNAQAQTYLSFNGFFDGYEMVSTSLLPVDFLYPLDVTEQQPQNTSIPFQRMTRANHGLPSVDQGFLNNWYEWRGDSLWFPGTLAPVIVKLRYKCAFPQFWSATEFESTLIPVMDCEDYVAYQTAYIVADALEGMGPASQSVQNLKQEATEALNDLKTAYVLQAQNTPVRRREYEGMTGDEQGWVF